LNAPGTEDSKSGSTVDEQGSEVMTAIRQRQSAKGPYDSDRPVSAEAMKQIVEAARWAPTPHNMQNFEIIVVDDKETLKTIGEIRSSLTEEYVRENLQQMSFSEEELLQKKVGLLGVNLPPALRDPARMDEAVHGEGRGLGDMIKNGPMLLIVLYDTRKRAPASAGDFLGILGLGCVMENMWLAASSLGVGVEILSVFIGGDVEKRVKQILKVPDYMAIAFGARLGYPIPRPRKYLRVRRDPEQIIHHNVY
jgi:nitroreductase